MRGRTTGSLNDRPNATRSQRAITIGDHKLIEVSRETHCYIEAKLTKVTQDMESLENKKRSHGSIFKGILKQHVNILLLKWRPCSCIVTLKRDLSDAQNNGWAVLEKKNKRCFNGT